MIAMILSNRDKGMNGDKPTFVMDTFVRELVLRAYAIMTRDFSGFSLDPECWDTADFDANDYWVSLKGHEARFEHRPSRAELAV